MDEGVSFSQQTLHANRQFPFSYILKSKRKREGEKKGREGGRNGEKHDNEFLEILDPGCTNVLILHI